jgi:hypothetical protein
MTEKSQKSLSDMTAEELLKVELPNSIITPAKTVTDLVTEPTQLVKTLVTELNMEFLLSGKYQPLHKLKKRVPELEEIGGEVLNDIFKQVNEILEEKRGLPPYQIEFKQVTTLDPQFVAACNILLDVADKRSQTAKLKDVGLTTKQWKNFMRVGRNQAYYEKLVDDLLTSDMWQESRVALAKNVAQGDLPSIKYLHELTNKFSPKNEFDPRILTYFMQFILEVITRHVDSQTARKIADELDQIAIKELT